MKVWWMSAMIALSGCVGVELDDACQADADCDSGSCDVVDGVGFCVSKCDAIVDGGSGCREGASCRLGSLERSARYGGVCRYDGGYLPAGAPCGVTEECASGSLCFRGACTELCDSHEGCGDGERCTYPSTGLPDGTGLCLFD